MKFIKIHKLNEGLFNTKAQMQAKIEKEKEKSDEDIISSMAFNALKASLKKVLIGFIFQVDPLLDLQKYVFPGNLTKVQGNYPYCEYNFARATSGAEDYLNVDYATDFMKATNSMYSIRFIATNINLELTDSLHIEIVGTYAYVGDHASATGNTIYMLPHLSVVSTMNRDMEEVRNSLSKHFNKRILNYVNVLKQNKELGKKNNYTIGEIDMLDKFFTNTKIVIDKIIFFKDIPDSLKIEISAGGTKEIKIVQNVLSSGGKIMAEWKKNEYRPDKYLFSRLQPYSAIKHNTEICKEGQICIDDFMKDAIQQYTNGLGTFIDIEQVDTNGGIGIMYNIPVVYSFNKTIKDMFKESLLTQKEFTDSWYSEHVLRSSYITPEEVVDMFTRDDIDIAYAFMIRFPCTVKNNELHIHPLVQGLDKIRVEWNMGSYSIYNASGISVKHLGIIGTSEEISIENISQILKNDSGYIAAGSNIEIKSLVIPGNVFSYIMELPEFDVERGNVVRPLFQKEVDNATMMAGRKIMEIAK